MDRLWGCLMWNVRAKKCFPVLGWTKIVYLQQVVVECADSGVEAQLSDHGLSGLYNPGDCLLGLKNHEVKKKQSGKFVLPGLPGRMSCGSGSGLGSTQYTKHQHHAELKFLAAVLFHRLMFLFPVALWVWRCNQKVHSCV